LAEGRSDIASQLGTELTSARERMKRLMRQASILDRSKRSEPLRQLLRSYDRYDQFTKSGLQDSRTQKDIYVYDIPQLVAAEMAKLVLATGPYEEQPLHHAALVLELSDLLYEKLQKSKDPRLDVVNTYVPLLDSAIRTVDQQPDDVKGVLTA